MDVPYGKLVCSDESWGFPWSVDGATGSAPCLDEGTHHGPGVCQGPGVCDGDSVQSPECSVATAEGDLPRTRCETLPLRSQVRRRDLGDEAVQGGEIELDVLPPVRPALEAGRPGLASRRQGRSNHKSFQQCSQGGALAALLLTIGSNVLSPGPGSVHHISAALGSYESLAGADSNVGRGNFERQSVGGTPGRGGALKEQKVKLNGSRRRVIHELDRAAAALEAEVSIYEASSTEAGQLRRQGPSKGDLCWLGVTLPQEAGSPAPLNSRESEEMCTQGLAVTAPGSGDVVCRREVQQPPADDVYAADLAQAYAGKALPTKLAYKFGLVAAPPADIIDGWDLSSVSGICEWRRSIEVFQPRVVIISMQCTLWCRMNSNINYRGDRRALLEALREGDKPQLRNMVWTMKKQHKSGRYFLFEQPVGSELYKEEPLEEVYDLPPNSASGAVVESCIGHGCMYGFRHTKTQRPIKKKFRWLANRRRLLQAVGLRCDDSHGEHDLIEGKAESVPSGLYTEELFMAILKAIQDLAAQLEPARFAYRSGGGVGHATQVACADVLYVDCSRNIPDWDRVVVLVEELLGRSSTKAPMTQDEGSSIWKAVSDFVPWEL